MVMHSGNPDGFNAKRSPLVQEIERLDLPKELIRSLEADDFITLLNFPDERKAILYTQCIRKCNDYGLTELKVFFQDCAKALVAVKGRRADLFAQMGSGLLVPGFFPGGKNGDSIKQMKETKPNA